LNILVSYIYWARKCNYCIDFNDVEADVQNEFQFFQVHGVILSRNTFNL
jgi:hypothetical protein